MLSQNQRMMAFDFKTRDNRVSSVSTHEFVLLLLCAVAALLHGLSGFGFPMMSTAVLSSQYSLSTAVALVILPCLVLNLLLISSSEKGQLFSQLKYYLGHYFPLILSSLLGSLIGVKLLLILNEGYLKLMMGIVMIVYVIDQCRASSFQIAATRKNMWFFGALAGLIGGATNAMAPFLMMYLLSAKLDKTEVVVASNLCFIASKLVQLVLLFPVLIALPTHHHSLLLWITVFALIGLWFGNRMRHDLSQQHFRLLVLALLFLLGGYALWQSMLHLQQTSQLLVIE